MPLEIHSSLTRTNSYRRIVFVSWALFFVASVVGLIFVIDAKLYSDADGEWAAWNALAILQYGEFGDPSPFSALAGMGSMYLPNLPWFNPGALALALPFSVDTNFVLSYVVYMIELAVSVVILARVIGLSWHLSHFAAQLLLLVTYLPFGAVFNHIEWYSSAPVYAHITSVLNVIAALFILIGRNRIMRLNFLYLACAGLLCVSAAFSGPFIFPFFAVPYVFIGVATFATCLTHRSELLWKIGLVLMIPALLFSIGYFDYLLSTAATAARTPGSSLNLETILSPGKLIALFGNHSLCEGDPRTLICVGNSIYWFNIGGIFGAIFMIFTRKGPLRAYSIAFVAFMLFVQFYAYLYQLSLLGPVSVLSTHFISWSSYSFIAIMFAGTLPVIGYGGKALLHQSPSGTSSSRATNFLVVRQLFVVLPVVLILYFTVTGGVLDPRIVREQAATQVPDVVWYWIWITFGVLVTIMILHVSQQGERLFAMLASPISKVRTAGSRLAQLSRAAIRLETLATMALCPLIAVFMLSDVRLIGKPPPTYTPEIVKVLRDESSLVLRGEFLGYTSTFWSNALEQEPEIAIRFSEVPLPYWRYALARQYFQAQFGSTLIEYDLWNHGIPTFEEYGQWVTRQAQIFAENFLANSPQEIHPTFLRVYKPDISIMALLGIRFVISDQDLSESPGIKVIKTEHSNGGNRIYLHEIGTPNIGSYSPTRLIVSAPHAGEIFALLRENILELQDVVIVGEDLDRQEALVPASDTRLSLIADGYRLTSTSEGRSAILLPIQYSHCLEVTKVHAGSSDIDIVRANFLQTLVIFSNSIDASIELQFGFPWKTHCRHQDAADIDAFTGE